MKRTIKFKTDVIHTGGVLGEYKYVSDSSWYLRTNAIAKQCGVTIIKMEIHDHYSHKYSKITVKCSNENQWMEFATVFMRQFRGYIKDLKVKL